MNALCGKETMPFCRNHYIREAFDKCSFCGQYLCAECYRKYFIIKERRKFGFCDIQCLNHFKEDQKINIRLNRKKSFRFLFLGIISISMSYLIMVLAYNFLPQNNLFINKVAEIFGVFLFTSGVVSLLYFLFGIIHGDNVAQLKNPF